MKKNKGQLDASQWYMVDTIVKAFITKFPKQYSAFVKANIISNSELDDREFGHTKQGTMRWSASFPVAYTPDGEEHSLSAVILKHFPNFIKSDDIFLEFLERYSEFRIAHKIKI